MFIIALFSSYGFALLLSLAFEVPVMNLDKILFGGGNSKRKPRQTSLEVAESRNGTKKALELAEFYTHNGNELEEGGVKVAEQQEPMIDEKENQTESA
jgi:hypothetical protein